MVHYEQTVRLSWNPRPTPWSVHYEQTVRLSWNGDSAVRPLPKDDEPTEMPTKGRRKHRLQRVGSRRSEAGAGNDERGAVGPARYCCPRHRIPFNSQDSCYSDTRYSYSPAFTRA